MVEVHPLLPLCSNHADVTTVEDDHVVAGVHCRVVDGLVLALQNGCYPFGRLERILPLSVEYVPEKTTLMLIITKKA